MTAGIREQVRRRAKSRCEYCLLPDFAVQLPYHVEHVVATVHRPDDDFANLAWACPRCNLKKGPNLATIDPDTNIITEIFNRRTMIWSDHFHIQAGTIHGLTPCGRGTVRLLGMNDEKRVAHRRALIDENMFGPAT
jgi:hypothetical protein